MDDAAPPLDAAPRRSRIGPFAITVALVFAIGLALIWIGMRDSDGWLKHGSAAAAEPSPVAASAATPPQPVTIVPTDAMTLASRGSALAAQLAVIEARTASIGGEVAAAADRAGRAEAILVAFAARRAIERGTSLGYLEEQLRLRFGQTQQQAVITVIQAAHDPVTIEALREALDANGPLLLSTGADGWFEGLAREFRNLVVLHDANVPSPLPADRLGRARRLLEAGQVEPALSEVGRLPGAAQATKWTAAAQRYVAARRALDTLETAAIVGTIPAAITSVAPLAPAPVAPVAPSPGG